MRIFSFSYFICFALLLFFVPFSAAESSQERKIILPPGYAVEEAKLKRFAIGKVIADMHARNFTQGNIVYCEVYLSKTTSKKNDKLIAKDIVCGKQSFPFTKKSWGYRAFFPISPNESVGKKSIKLIYSINGENITADLSFQVGATAFQVRKGSLNLGKYSVAGTESKPEVAAFIKESRQKKDKAFASREADLIGTSFAHPRDMHYITSPFWSKRVYERYVYRKGRKVKLPSTTNVHSGLDLRGQTGTPVFAMADGKVVLADFLYYEGNMVIIDHGNRLFSYYMHMSKLTVKQGDMIKAGDKIGLVGSTGVSTAAHLHVSMLVAGTHVDPLSLLCLPVRN